MAPGELHEFNATRWMWIESLGAPAAVIDLSNATIIAANSKLARLLGKETHELAGSPSSGVMPDYMLPTPQVVSGWVAEAAEGRVAGSDVDLLIEPHDSDPVRADGRIGPVDAVRPYLLLTIQEAISEKPVQPAVDEAMLGLMSEIGSIIGTSLELDAVTQRFSTSLMQVVPSDHVAVMLLEEDGEWLRPVYSSGRSAATERVPLADTGPMATVLKTQSAVLLDEFEIGELRAARTAIWSLLDPSMLAACSVPMVASGQPIGVVLVASTVREAINSEHLALLEHACSQIAGAMSNIQLHEKLAESALERDVLANIGRLSGAATDLDGAMPAIAAEIQRLMPVAQMSVHESDEMTGELNLAYRWTSGELEGTIDASSLLARTMDSGEQVFSNVQLTNKGESTAFLASAITFGGQAIGVLSIESLRTEPHGPRESMFVSLLANQLAGTLHTARAFRSQIQENRLRRSLAQISLAASRDLAPTSVFERISNEVAELLAHDLFAIALPTDDHSAMEVRFKIGTDAVDSVYESYNLTMTDPDEWGVVLLENASTEPRYEAIVAAGIKSVIEVPLGVQDSGVNGYLLVGSHEEGAFTNQHLTMLAHVAEQVTPAINNALAHEQAVALAEARMGEARASARSDELEKISDAKSQFLSVVSHELRTPLTSIIAYSEMLERNAGDGMSEKQVSQAKVITKSALHLKFLISDLLDVSRIESGNLSLTLSRFDIDEVVRDVVDQIEPVLAEKSQELVSEITSDPMRLHADRARIVQIVSNLIENASKYSPANTVIRLSVVRLDGQALISVSDEGIGISSEDQKQLFVPFFRANTELTHTVPGTGLGLSLVKRIAELHGGSVRVRSEPGKGSTFSVALQTDAEEQAA